MQWSEEQITMYKPLQTLQGKVKIEQQELT